MSPTEIAICATPQYAEFPFVKASFVNFRSDSIQSRLVDPGRNTGFPKVKPNDNRISAGKMRGSTLEVRLDVMWSDFHPEGLDHPGVRLIAIAEEGKSPSVPAPLIRVKTGTTIKATIHNSLSDSTLTIHGMVTRPAIRDEVFIVQPGETRELVFEAGAPGTYMYWITTGRGMPPKDGDEEQLAGALIIDPEKGSPPDRIFIINLFTTRIDKRIHPYGWLEAFTINGSAYPMTEPITMSVNDTVRWRIINASQIEHPMHLHGFYYRVKSIGTPLVETVFAESRAPLVVTQFTVPRSTYTMEWIPTRPGRWMYHCHIPGHVSSALRFPGSNGLDEAGHEQHMSGLMVRFDVMPGPTDLVSKGEPRNVTLFANDYSAAQNRFSWSPEKTSKPTTSAMLVLKQFQATYVTVKNQMQMATGVHWHGLEIDGWSDGIPEFSSSDGRMSPKIEPGLAFTYKLSTMRAGTFIYHSHLDDQNQFASGLYGAMIVIPENETYDSTRDHVYLVGSNHPSGRKFEQFDLNGRTAQPTRYTSKNLAHRLRLINIAVEDRFYMTVTRNGITIPIQFIAKDGADLPAAQRAQLKESPMFGVGETGDFIFKPIESGEYVVQVTNEKHKKGWTELWVVK